MVATKADLFNRLRELDISVTTFEHRAVFTVHQSRSIRGDIDGGHCKNLFLNDKSKQLWLLITLEDTMVDLKKLRHLIGSRHLSFCRETLLEDVLGVKAGGVTPFALLNDHEQRVNVVLDSNVLEHELLNFHPLENTSTTTIRSSDLVHFINGCGHSPQIIDLHTYG
jgi:Ala-tRNA(Pro) deacylase|tara:strand:+ start:384 stop:884 length:501 start_codon:yes stop_codon:yes gene_type:complete